MRIGIDFHAAERDGTGNCTYIRNLVEHLVRLAPEHEYILYITDASNAYYKRFQGLRNVRLSVVPSPSAFVRMLLLGLRTFSDRTDVLHATYYGPPFYRGKLLLTVHDLSFLHIPDTFSAFDRIKDRLLIPFYIKRARAVLTVSEYSRRDIIDAYHAPYDRICVHYNAVDPVFKPVEDAAPARRTLEGYGIPADARYILFVGRINKRKNLPRLVRSFDALKAKGFGQRLVIAGAKDFLPDEDEAAITGALLTQATSYSPASCPIPISPCCTALRTFSSILPFTKGSASPVLRRWPAAARWSAPTPRRCRR